MSWFAPFYQGYRDFVNVFYRETSDPALLTQANLDIREPDFKVKNLFLVTFRSLEQTFQMVLATDGETTYAVMNYEELNYNAAGDIEVNEVWCQKRRVLIPEANSRDILFNGNSTGIKGRHVFKLTRSECFTKILGLKTFQEDIVLTKHLLNDYQQVLPGVFTTNETAKIAFHLKEIIAENASVVTVFSKSLQTSPHDFSSRYGIFSPTNMVNVKINNLFVIKETQRSGSFQYGNVTIHQLESGIRCEHFRFEMKMNSTPVLKINAHVEDGRLNNLVNVWLKNVSYQGFEVCAKEMLDFSGVRDLHVPFVAVTKNDGNIQEASHMIISHQPNNQIQCFDHSFENTFSSPPNVFTSIESLAGDLPVILWTRSVSKTKANICVIKTLSSPLTITSKSSNFKIHLIIKGNLSSCNTFSCPNHLECHLKADLKAFCGCLKSCRSDNRSFCGSDFKDYDSVCLLNKQHCERYGSGSKSNITVLHYGKCQGMNV